MKIAVQGCGHGELDKIYETVKFIENKQGIKVDLLLCCGDFQSVRNEADMECMAVPKKYRQINTFYKYYSGEQVAPVLTVFIGGNHEASNYLAELPYGGWVAPNIYYIGYAGILEYGGIRIGGLSGIFKGHDYKKGHYEMPPYSPDSIRSAYHIRNLEVFRLKQIRQPLDIMMSHDWPRGVYHHGNTKQLISKKTFMREEVENSTLGSGPTAELLDALHPDYWFSAHLHVKFAALIKHQLASGEEKFTKFLALDKCLPGRAFLQVLDIPSTSQPPYHLNYDPEWLAVLQSTNQFMSVSPKPIRLPDQSYTNTSNFSASMAQILQVKSAFKESMKIPENFCKTAPAYDPNNINRNASQPSLCINPQTKAFCLKLKVSDPCEMLLSEFCLDGRLSPLPSDDVRDEGRISDENVNDGDIDSASSRNLEGSLVEDSEISFSVANETYVSFDSSINSSMCKTPGNPEEISLDEDDNDEDKEEGKESQRSRLSLNPSEIDISDDDDEKEGTKPRNIPEVRINLEKDLEEVVKSPSLKPRFKGLIACSFPDIPETDTESGSELDSKLLLSKKRICDIQGSSSRDASDEASLSGDTERSDCGLESDREDRPLGKKKLKRRNFDIYSSNDGDDES